MTSVRANTLNSVSRYGIRRQDGHSESGVTILEMVVAMLLLTVGLLSLAASIGYAVTVSNRGRNITNTKLLVVSVLEQMETLRNTQQLTFAQIANVGDPTLDNTGATRTFSGFPTGFQPLTTDRGADGILGTADDLSVFPGYSRQIAITSLSPNLKRIEVTVRYPDPSGRTRDLVGVSYLNNDARAIFY